MVRRESGNRRGWGAPRGAPHPAAETGALQGHFERRAPLQSG